VTNLGIMVLMFTDANSRLTAYMFKFNIFLSVKDSHRGLDKVTGMLLLPSGSYQNCATTMMRAAANMANNVLIPIILPKTRAS